MQAYFNTSMTTLVMMPHHLENNPICTTVKHFSICATLQMKIFSSTVSPAKMAQVNTKSQDLLSYLLHLFDNKLSWHEFQLICKIAD